MWASLRTSGVQCTGPGRRGHEGVRSPESTKVTREAFLGPSRGVELQERDSVDGSEDTGHPRVSVFKVPNPPLVETPGDKTEGLPVPPYSVGISTSGQSPTTPPGSFSVISTETRRVLEVPTNSHPVPSGAGPNLTPRDPGRE